MLSVVNFLKSIVTEVLCSVVALWCSDTFEVW